MEQSSQANSHATRPPASDPTRTQIRRTQIREAQRAYRHRQQSLIGDLKARVAHLEDVLDQLEQTMDVFRDQVVQRGSLLQPTELVQAVQLLDEEMRIQLKQRHVSTSEHRETASTPSTPTEKFQEKITRLVSERSTCGIAADRPPERNLQRAVNTSSTPFWRLFFGSNHSLLPPIQPTSESDSPVPSMSCLLQPETPKIIEYATTFFSQKLFRACLESGYRYLTNSSVSDQDMWPEFGLVLQYISREEITAYFQRVLELSPCNPIYDCRFPFISLGNAGRHSLWAEAGLLAFRNTNGIQDVPSDEEWFDIKDLEGLLQDRGIQLVDQQNFIEATTDENLGLSMIVDQTQIADMVPLLDEDALIDKLSRQCISLGCAPGFRRRDVEILITQHLHWKYISDWQQTPIVV